MMTYLGYIGDVEYDDQAKVFHGEVVNTRDVITFQGTSVAELEQAFHTSVDDYVSWCEEEGIPPEKPYSGKFNLRLSPELHREIAIAAKRLDTSINAFVERAIQDELRTIDS
jgi:predicted HicB family RNase H-like nuclease